MSKKTELAAICGLYCGTCPSYGKECDGCLSNRVAYGCDVCGNGFRDCAKSHHVIRCHECEEFPCKRLEEFSKKHIVNGICHHENVIKDLYSMREYGVEEWVEEQKEKNTCKTCGKHILWYERECSYCSKKAGY